MAVSPTPPDEPARDVLAAEEFAVPAPDPGLHHEAAHDVLAAEEFAVPAPDPTLRHGPVTLPGDPTGITEPHDVLAAEEFAMPAAPAGGESLDVTRRPPRSRAALLTAAAVGLLLVLAGRVRRRG